MLGNRAFCFNRWKYDFNNNRNDTPPFSVTHLLAYKKIGSHFMQVFYEIMINHKLFIINGRT